MTVERKGASVCALTTAPNLEEAPAASGHLPPSRAGLGGVLLMAAPPVCPTPAPRRPWWAEGGETDDGALTPRLLGDGGSCCLSVTYLARSPFA